MSLSFNTCLLLVNFTDKTTLLHMMASESEFKVLSWNIRGLKTRLNEKEALLAIFGKYDVVLLQETHIGEKDIRKITEAFGGEYDIETLKDKEFKEQLKRERKTMYLTLFSSSSKGVAILINKPHTRLEAICEGGDYAWVHAGTGNQKYTFVSVYYHSGDDHLICDLMVKIFSSFLRSGSEAFKCRPVFGGDFNTTLDDQDVKNAHGPRRKRLIRFMSILQLSDVWKEMHKGESRSESERYMHSCSKPISRLDYFFMLNQDLKYVQSCEICKDIDLSDHFPLSLSLKMSETDVEELNPKMSSLKVED